ncbi:hypothetical protein DRO97_08650 [Archaeoglobales archaeon]|nr:MAG: hypothetical protein DRO97_08650 [Archaeoglobales archaeon]
MLLVEKRDGRARIGKLINNKEFDTPLLIDFLEKKDFELVNSMDFGLAPYPVKEIDLGRYKILGSKDKDFVILAGLRVLQPRKLVEVFNSLNTLKPIYTPALADPINLPLLIYLGVDVVDNIIPIIEAYNGIYYTNDAKFDFGILKELPCNCPICKGGIDKLKDAEYKERSRLIALHNTEVMHSQLRLIKEMIRNENFRNFVEAKAKLMPDLTVILRIADDLNYGYKFHSAFKKSKVYFNTLESFNRPELKLFFERAFEAYKPQTKTLLILPCTAKKPYLLSRTHSIIRAKYRIKVNEIIVSSPLVVPREFELVYPAINYDTPVTGHWSNEEIAFVAEKLRKFVEKGNFEKIIAHVDGGYKRVVERALHDYDVEFTSNGNLLSNVSLSNLKRALEGRNEKLDLYNSMFEHIVRYQFGVEMDLMLSGDSKNENKKKIKIRGRYPNLEVFSSNERIARIDTIYGMLDVYYPFARFLVGRGVYTVKIGDFEPKGTIFAIGVEEADNKIRPNDVVIFYNNRVLGVGRAYMSGEEMVEAEGGIAIVVKRKWKW